eukprot:g2048.t1
MGITGADNFFFKSLEPNPSVNRRPVTGTRRTPLGITYDNTALNLFERFQIASQTIWVLDLPFLKPSWQSPPTTIRSLCAKESTPHQGKKRESFEHLEASSSFPSCEHM